jgi:hypothetical protein
VIHAKINWQVLVLKFFLYVPLSFDPCKNILARS